MNDNNIIQIAHNFYSYIQTNATLKHTSRVWAVECEHEKEHLTTFALFNCSQNLNSWADYYVSHIIEKRKFLAFQCIK